MVPPRFPLRTSTDRRERPAGHHLVGLSVTLLLALSAGGPAHADCPTSTVTAWTSNGGTDTHTSSLPKDQAARSDGGTSCSDYCYSWGESSGADYDLVAGTMHAAASTVGSGHGQASASTHDVFTLLGPAAAPPITFHAHAIVRTGIYCGYGDVAQAYASISDGAFEGAGIAGSTDSCLVTTDLPISISRASGSTLISISPLAPRLVAATSSRTAATGPLPCASPSPTCPRDTPSSHARDSEPG